MTAPAGDDAVTYEERDATPEEADRGRMLEALAHGQPYVFVWLEPVDGSEGLRVRVDASEVLDALTIRALLTKTAAAIR